MINGKVYKAAIIGLGKIAWRFDAPGAASSPVPLSHAGAFEKDSRTIIAGGMSVDEDDRREFAKRYRVPAFASVEELFEYVTPDIVSICSPSAFHFEHVRYCLDKRVPMIWLEKPPAETLDEINALIIENEAKSVSKVLVNYPRRYSDVYRKLKRIHDSNTFGKSVLAHITYSRTFVVNGFHMLDLAFYITGDREEALLDSVMNVSSRDNPSFSFRFPDGFPVVVTGMDLPYQCADFTLTCEHGRAAVLYSGLKGRIETCEEFDDFPGFYRLVETEDNVLTPEGPSAYLPSALSDLIAAYESDKEPLSNLVSARRSIVLWEAVKAEWLKC
jgi:predicted dehydrogenase